MTDVVIFAAVLIWLLNLTAAAWNHDLPWLVVSVLAVAVLWIVL